MRLLDDEDLVLSAAREVGEKAQHMEVIWHPNSVIQIVGLLQLALRHPAVSPAHTAVAGRFIDGARQYFADSPAVLELIRRGSDPSEDRPAPMFRKES
jgi:hypothetical protein